MGDLYSPRRSGKARHVLNSMRVACSTAISTTSARPCQHEPSLPSIATASSVECHCLDRQQRSQLQRACSERHAPRLPRPNADRSASLRWDPLIRLSLMEEAVLQLTQRRGSASQARPFIARRHATERRAATPFIDGCNATLTADNGVAVVVHRSQHTSCPRTVDRRHDSGG